MCWVCAGLFERLEFCEAQGLGRVGALVREALGEHGRELHMREDFTTKDTKGTKEEGAIHGGVVVSCGGAGGVAGAGEGAGGGGGVEGAGGPVPTGAGEAGAGAAPVVAGVEGAVWGSGGGGQVGGGGGDSGEG